MRTLLLSLALLLLAPSSRAADAVVDTFLLYGGPDTLEGKFQTALGLPDWGGWTTHDLSFVPNRWHRSTFNAETLGDHGVDNHAMWCGVEAETPGYATAPGYGNDWNDRLRFVSEPLVDPSVGQVVELDFLFHIDTEPAYDFFTVDHDSAGTMRTEFGRDGTDAVSGVFSAPGLRYSQTSPTLYLTSNEQIDYQGGDYGGPDGDRIVIDLSVFSDGAYSDEDGLWPTTAGAVQVDDLVVRYDDGTGRVVEVLEDFEGPGPYAFQPWVEEAYGDFARLFADLEDLDPCSENATPMVGFSSAGAPLDGEVRSPPIALDLPGSEDDAAEIVGLRLAFDVWPNLPAGGDRSYRWQLRFSDDGGTTWVSPFASGGLRQGPALWRRDEVLWFSSSSLQDWTHVQIALGARQLDGAKATDEGPRFDDVRLDKFRVKGPRVAVETSELAHDAFPPSGLLDASTTAARAELSIPFDASHEDDGAVARGDSVVVVVDPVLEGVTISQVRMVWALYRNPLFDDVREVPSLGIYREIDTSQPGLWTGETLQQFPRHPDGRPIPNTWYFVLPDEDFFYPGDRIRYYFRVTDSLGRVSTLPEDVGGFADGGSFDPRFEVRGLPTLVDAQGDQPSTLLVATSGFDGERDALLRAHAQLGRIEGVDHDLYDVGAAWEFNGLGAVGGHGPSLAQIAAYDVVLVATGDRVSPLSAADAALLQSRASSAGDQHVVHFGDAWASGLDALGAPCLGQTLGVQVTGGDPVDVWGATSARVEPALPSFSASFFVDGGCPAPRRFDGILPVGSAQSAFSFVDAGGVAFEELAAAVLHDADPGPDEDLALGFPFSLASAWSEQTKAPGSRSAAALLLENVYAWLQSGGGSGAPTAAPSTPARLELSAAPNPFNPATTLRFALPRRGEVRVEIFDLRGARVRELWRGELGAGPHALRWKGIDDAGGRVASGVYLVRLRADGVELHRKLALLK